MTMHPTSRRLLLCATAIALASCDSFVAPKPTDVLAPENFYKSASDALAAVNSAYEQTRWGHFLGYWYVSDIATDDIIASANFGSDGHRMSNYIFDANEFPLGDIWGNSYKVINRSNAVIDRVPGITMDATLRTRIVSEARFLRAFAYFDLVRCFGDVPLLQHEVSSLTGLEVPRAPMTDVYASMIADLKAAAAGLPASYTGGDIGRATSGAAQALLAKVYLNQKDYTNAAATAGALIASGRYSLNPVWKDNFTISKEFVNPESIFELNFDGTLNPGGGSVSTLFSLPSNFPGGDAYGLMQVAPSLVAMFAPGDQRGNHGTFMISPYTDKQGRVTTWSMPVGAAFDKYLDETNTQNMTSRAWQGQPNNWIILRYADVLLIYAEAVAEGGAPSGPTALGALNQVRARAGIPTIAVSGPALRDSVRVERRREFVFEGQRWFDLSRWGILDQTFKAKTAEVAALFPGETTVHGVPSNLLPLPQGELNANHNLTQNPGW